jgi:hypothetical protein
MASEDDGVGVVSIEDTGLASDVCETASEEIALGSGVIDELSEDTLALSSGVLVATSVEVETSGVAVGVGSGVGSGVLEAMFEEVATLSVELRMISAVVSGVLEAASEDGSTREALGVGSGVIIVTSVAEEPDEASVTDALVGDSLSALDALTCESLEADRRTSLDSVEECSTADVVDGSAEMMLDEDTEAETSEEATDEEACDTTTTLELVVATPDLDAETDTVLQSTATMETSSMSKYGPSDGLLSTLNWSVWIPFDRV